MPRKLALTLALLSAAGCARMSGTATQAGVPSSSMSMAAPSPDLRLNLKPGWFDAGEAAWNMRLVSTTQPSADFINRADPGDSRVWNSDLAFTGNYVIQGNFAGWQVWDVSNPAKPTLKTAYLCIGSQSDVSVFGHLLFESTEATNARVDCSPDGVSDTVSSERARGIRIYDITDIAHPKRLVTVQTCRGSHTHSLVTSPNDPDNVYVYVSGSAPVRSPNELAGCSAMDPSQDPNSELFRIEVIQVPLAHPEQAHVVSKPAILAGLGPNAKHGEMSADSVAAMAALKARGITEAEYAKMMGPSNIGPVQCHDITVYPAIARAAGACRGYGVLLDITDPAQPKRIGTASDTNFVAWHSATFNNDGTKVLFTDEWGGGTQPRCRVTDHKEWGADEVFTLDRDGTTHFGSYYKLPAAQTSTENCVAHNGSLIPVPGRDIMVQGWYQGGVSVFDFTDPTNVHEIAYFDRGPMDANKLEVAGSWSAYWYNGYIYSSEIARGLDVMELKPSGWLSQNEIDAAKSARLDELNVQDQPMYKWTPSFVVARAYVDQLEREKGLSSDRVAAIRGALAAAEKASGDERRSALSGLASQLASDASTSSESAKVNALAEVVRGIGG